MKIFKQNAITYDLATMDPLEVIERAGRTCWKSDDKICEGSAYNFVKRIINAKHYAMLEHGKIPIHITIKAPCTDSRTLSYDNSKLRQIKMPHCPEENNLYATTSKHEKYILLSLRTLLDSQHVEANMYHNCICKALFTTKFRDTPTGKLLKETVTYTVDTFADMHCNMFSIEVVDYQHLIDNRLIKVLPITTKYLTNRGITHEFVRHRLASFAQASTRYIDYSNIPVIDPYEGLVMANTNISDEDNRVYADELINTAYTPVISLIEDKYAKKINGKSIPRDFSRNILPNCIATELVVTTTLDHYKRTIIPLRYYGSTGKPHPEFKSLMYKFGTDLKENMLDVYKLYPFLDIAG